MLETALSCVKDFMQEHRLISKERAFERAPIFKVEAIGLNIISTRLEEVVTASSRHSVPTAIHALRLHLMCEELGELAHAIAVGDEITALDALTDLLYVVLGTAIEYRWDLSAAFNEVHKSNMTKAPREGNDPRLRVKGPAYSPPNLAQIIKDRDYARIRHRRSGLGKRDAKNP